MICFVILHYMVLEETEGCVRSLDKLIGEKSIVIVDNASPNGSGEKLAELYENREDVTVVLNKENSGFARGNNLGCQVAKEEYDPAFYVVINNDIEFLQADFIKRVYDIYMRDSFDVLGPDIYSTTEKVHQSPKSLKRTSIEESRRLLSIYEKKISSRITVPIRCFLKRFDSLKRAVKKSNNRNLEIDYKKKYYDTPLHGSCFIFSKRFIDSREKAFFDGTFFYYESEILDYECQIAGFRSVYDPSIKVLHHQNVSTNTVYKNELKKVRFMNEQNYNSIKAFLDKYE